MKLKSMTCITGLFLLALSPKISAAYSILTHEAVIDSAWDKDIARLSERSE